MALTASPRRTKAAFLLGDSWADASINRGGDHRRTLPSNF